MKPIHELKPLVVGVGGPVGTGKTTVVEKLCKTMSSSYEIAVVTNDIYCKEDAAILTRLNALDAQRIIGVETGACPHQAIRDDVSANLEAIETLVERFPNLEIIFVESGGDNLAASFSPELVDIELYVIDVAGGEKIPRKGGPGIMNSDLLLINKIDIAQYVGSSLEVMERDSKMMRGERPFIMTDMYSGKGLSALQTWIGEQVAAKNNGQARPVKPVNTHNHLPPRYQDPLTVKAAPMPAAELIYDSAGRVAWDEIWGSFCDLALAGGPAHRGSLLEPVAPEQNSNRAAYETVFNEIARGISMISNLKTCQGQLGWIGVQCANEDMALWMLRAIVAENISVRRENTTLFVPVGADFRLEYEIKNIVTVFAKTFHYWQEHSQSVAS